MTGDKARSLIERIQKINPDARLVSDLFRENPDNPFGRFERRKIITDKEWTKLKELSGLPDQDRRHVEIYIDLYRAMRIERLSTPTLSPSQTREQLQTLAKDARALHEGIERVLDNDLAVLVLSEPPDKVWEPIRLWALSDELLRFSEMVQDAAERCERGRPGPGDDNLWGLIVSLAEIGVTTSNKRCGPDGKWNALEFIISGVHIADPSFKAEGKDGTIENLVKKMARKKKVGKDRQDFST
jgi:hypothetical protein